MEYIEKAKKVLIIDSEISYIAPLRNGLTKAGYEVICWDDDQKAFDLVKNLAADMIICEVEFSQLSGLELFKEVRSVPAYRSIPFIFLSNQKKVDDRIKSMELGVDDYITKPFYVEEVVARVDALFEEISQINRARSESEQGFSGSLLEMNLVDLIQTLELGKKSAIIKLRHDSSLGVVYIQNGEVIDAVLDDSAAEPALMKMFTWNIGNFYIEIVPVNRERRINIHNIELFNAAMEYINQWEQIKKGLPPLNTIVGKTDLNTYENLSEEEKKIINSIDENKKISTIIEQSRLDDLKSLALIKNLYQKGYLQETEDNYNPDSDEFLARLKKNASQSRTTRERVISLIANTFQNSGNVNHSLEGQRPERRQLPDRRKYGRRREDRLKESNQIRLTKADLHSIRERLS